MENYIIIGIIVIAFGFGIYSTVKHFKGEGGCCGGSSYKTKKKKLSSVSYCKLFRIEGMHCENCKNRVEEIINDIQGLSRRVNLKKGELVVSYEADVDNMTIKARIERAGFTVTEIKKLTAEKT